MSLRKEEDIIKKWSTESRPLVSITCCTYNQEKYIADAIEGFLIQETKFPFEVIINDDASQDNTPVIIKHYEGKYPKIIKPIYQKENQFSKKISIWSNITFPISQGKYIAMCEGDDFWTDPLKLQKQVDFLENHKEYSMCCTNYKIIDSNNKILQERGWTGDKTQSLITQEVVVRKYTPQTLTVLLRSKWVKEIIHDRLFPKAPNDDYYLFSVITGCGPCYFIDEITGCYRHNENGVWSKKSNNHQMQMRFLTLELLNQNFHHNKRIQAILIERLCVTAKSLAISFIRDFRFYLALKYIYYYLFYFFRKMKFQIFKS